MRDLIMRCKHDSELEFRWTLLGKRFSRTPEAMKAIEEDHGEVIDRMGGVETRSEYLDLLQECDWVTSTARHEFFGIAVVEAMLCGCLPWLPDRLSYPELLPEGSSRLTPGCEGIDRERELLKLWNHLAPARAEIAVRRIEESIIQLI